ncbi:MAG: LysE family transporter [Clostridia bacterium]|nr:LysE family transporter [Clostridia bacterium]
MDLAGLFIYMLVGAITPGPNNFMCLYLGARHGLKGARRFLIGSMGSVFVKMLLCGLLNLALASLIPGLVPYMKWLGAAYMAYLGLHILLSGIRESKNPPAEGDDIPAEKASSYKDGILLQILNIKSWIYALSIFSIYVVPYSAHFSSILLWSAIATLTLCCSSLLWVLFGTVIKNLYAKYRIPCDAVMCLSLIYCAITAIL